MPFEQLMVTLDIVRCECLLDVIRERDQLALHDGYEVSEDPAFDRLGEAALTCAVVNLCDRECFPPALQENGPGQVVVFPLSEGDECIYCHI